jgi:hypothetical protein
MSAITIAGDTSGSITLDAPAVAGTTVLTLPATSGTVLTTASPQIASPAFSAGQTTAVTPSSNTFTKITINSIQFDTNSNFNTSTNRFTPTVAGYYQFNGSAYIQGATSTNLSDITVFRNGINAISGTVFYSAVTTYTTMKCTVAGIVYMNGTTDYAELFGRVIGTGALAFSEGIFSGSLVRAA